MMNLLSPISAFMDYWDTTTALSVLLTGFVVVFCILILLIVIVKIYSTIVSSAQNKGKKKTVQTAVAPAAAKPAPVAKAPTPSTNGISDEVVAVITAAVEASTDGTVQRVTSIKKAPVSYTGRRSNWGKAGVSENTRSF